MAVLQIFAGKKSGFKKNTITSFGNFQGNPSFPYVETNGFTPSDYNVSEGSIIVNNNTGVSTVVTGIESSFFVIMETQYSIRLAKHMIYRFQIDFRILNTLN